MSLPRRFEERVERPIHRDSFVPPWPKVALVAVDSPHDPSPSLCIAALDGVPRGSSNK